MSNDGLATKNAHKRAVTLSRCRWFHKSRRHEVVVAGDVCYGSWSLTRIRAVPIDGTEWQGDEST